VIVRSGAPAWWRCSSREDEPNQIMQVAQRLGTNLTGIDPDNEAYASWSDVYSGRPVRHRRHRGTARIDLEVAAQGTRQV
jgi:hypothetical protein